jgi:hypothetical protein
LQLSLETALIVVVFPRVHVRAKRFFHDIPQQGHDRNYRHDPQVDRCTLNRELDVRGEED